MPPLTVPPSDEPHVQEEGGCLLELAPARPTYLLVYLACRGEWVSREALAGASGGRGPA
jgi:hypothetical protein